MVSMGEGALALLLLATVSTVSAGSSWPSTEALPLSYVLADNQFLEDELVAFSDEDPASVVARYLAQVQRTLGSGVAVTVEEDEDVAERHRFRRQLQIDSLTTLRKDPQGVFLLENLVQRFHIPTKFPNDVVLFTSNASGSAEWYAAALEADGASPQTTLANRLVMYKLTGNRFLEQGRVPTYLASSLAVWDMAGRTYVVAAERGAKRRAAPEGGSFLYTLTAKGLEKVQTLYTLNPSDLCSWSYRGQHYLAVTSEFNDTFGQATYSADTLVYQWYNKHLDIVQRLPTTGARAVTAFTIDDIQYLAVVNHIDDWGNTSMKSVVYRFDLVKLQFVVHQPFETHGGVDVDFFTMDWSRGSDHFLVVANSFYQGPDGARFPETYSVIYKWAESNNFVAFQSLKLVGASQWTHYSGPRGESVLLAASLYGLHAFQYNGWRFQPLEITGEPSLVGFGVQIVSLRTAVFDSEGLVVMANKKNPGTQTNVYSLQFEKSSPLEKLRLQLRSWCEDKLALLETDSVVALVEQVRNAPKKDAGVIEVENMEFEANATIHLLETAVINTKVALDPAIVQDLNSVAAGLKRSEKDLADARATIEQALTKDGVNEVDRVVLANASVSCAGPCRFGHVDVLLLNNENVPQFQQNTLTVDTDIDVNVLRFTNLVVPGDLVAQRVLDQEAPLVSRVATRHLHSTLEVDELLLDGGLIVDGLVDNTRISTESILLVDGDQRFKDFVTSSRWEVDKLVLHGRVNGMTVDVTKPQLPPEVDVAAPESRRLSLAVKNLILDGKLGGVYIGDVHRRALRTTGRQEVTGELTFDRLTASSASMGSAGGIDTKQLARTDRKEVVAGMLSFSHPLAAKRVQVYEKLNEIGVARDGSMDLLLRQAGALRVSGRKWVRRVNVTNEARVRGRIPRLVLPSEDGPVVRVIQEDIEYEGEVTISGRVNVAGLVVASDVVEQVSGLSVLAVLENAVPLGATLPPSVQVQDLEVTNLDVTLVNGHPTSSWILDAPGAVVHLKQPAHFSEGLTVSGSSALHGEVNGVNLLELQRTALTTTGYQVVPGHKTFASLAIPAVASQETVVGDALWKDVWEERVGEAQRGQGRPPRHDVVRLEGNLVINGSLELKRLTLHGLLDGVNVDATLKDSVFQDDSVVVIDGLKTFTQTVRVDNLNVNPKAGGSDLSNIMQASEPVPMQPDDELTFKAPWFNIQRPLSVKNLNFYGQLDGVGDEDWSVPWLEDDGDQTVVGDLAVLGDLHALSGVVVADTINDVNPTRFAEQVACIDDPALYLGHVNFVDPVVSEASVTADLVGGLNVSDALLSRGADHQIMDGRVEFRGGLETVGSLKLVGMLAGENFADLCRFANPSPVALNTPQHLTVQGDLFMDQEPVVKYVVNGKDMGKLMRNTWLRNQPALIGAQMEFGNVYFQADVTVKSRIDGVDLNALAERYFSVTADRTVTTKLNVQGDVEVQGRLDAEAGVQVEGLVGGLRLRELEASVLLDGRDQDIPAHMTFGTVHTTSDLVLTGTINGLDLTKDVVLNKDIRIESLRHNVVSARKTLLSASAVDLGLRHTGVHVQDVDLVAWIQGAVRVDGDYTVTGMKTLHTPQVVGDLIVSGLVGGVRVGADHLLLRHGDQVVTGAKVMRPAPLQGQGTRVTHLEVGGRVNGVNVRDLLANVAFWTSDVEVKSPVDMAAGLRARAAWLNGLYQGVNVSELIYYAKNPVQLNEYLEQHAALASVAGRVQRSLRSQSFYLNYFHAAGVLQSDVRAVLPLGLQGNPAFAVMLITEPSLGSHLIASPYVWDSERGTLAPHPTLSYHVLPPRVRIIEPATFSGHNAIYWETHDEASGVHHGRILGLLADGRLGRAELFRDAVGSAWVSVTSSGTGPSCLIRGHPGSFRGHDGFCALHCITTLEEGSRSTRLPAPRPMHATALTVAGEPYLFVASGASESTEGAVSVWRWESPHAAWRSQPVMVQRLEVMNASAVAAVEYRGVYYLASASGSIEGAPHNGVVHISRFEPSVARWNHWHSEEVQDPRTLQFAVLPSGELVLYVVTDCPAESLVVLQYRGLAGFVRRAALAVPVGHTLSAFNTVRHQHVVAVTSLAGRATLLQAAFKGSYEASQAAYRAALDRASHP